ncbi:ribonuclease domain-containing protein [Fusibacter bizertensis]
MNKRNAQKNGMLSIAVLIVAVLIIAIKFIGLTTDSVANPMADMAVESTGILTETLSTPEATERVETTTAETTTAETTTAETTNIETTIDESSYYYKVNDVALYLHTFGHLPPNYITKDEAKEMGWVSEKGNLWDVADGRVIGGDYFGNYEGNLPEASGRKYYECDVNYGGGYRDANRIVFSNDGLIYYTDDHYKTFKKLY